MILRVWMAELRQSGRPMCLTLAAFECQASRGSLKSVLFSRAAGQVRAECIETAQHRKDESVCHECLPKTPMHVQCMPH